MPLILGRGAHAQTHQENLRTVGEHVKDSFLERLVDYVVFSFFELAVFLSLVSGS